MTRKTVLHLALASALVGLPAVASAVEMGSAPVKATPVAAKMGAARLETADVKGARLLSLESPGVADTRALKLRRIEDTKRGQPFEIGYARTMPGGGQIALGKLGWQPLSGGRLGARFEISSDSAAAMRAGLALKSTGRGNPAGVTFRFAGNDGFVFEQNGREFAGADIGWSPVVGGAVTTVEVVLAKGQKPTNFSLRIPQISHLDVSPIASTRELARLSGIGTSGACEKDIVCRVNPTAGFLAAEKAVARMTFTSKGKTYLCTGTLLNNSNTTKRHLFWTAAHCISTQRVADTLQTYWFYKATTCGGTTEAPGLVTLAGGAFLRHANTTRDTALLELKSAPPAGAVYAAWNSTPIGATGTAIEGIHHPRGDTKMYSLGSVTGLNTTLDGKSPLYQVVWNTGVTEGGSSGSALFTIASNGDYQLRGGLYGGTSFCSAPNDPDAYSRFSDVFSTISSYFGP